MCTFRYVHIDMQSQIISKFASFSFITKYDLLAQLNPGVNKTAMACGLKNLDNILMHCLVTNKTIPTNGKISGPRQSAPSSSSMPW